MTSDRFVSTLRPLTKRQGGGRCGFRAAIRCVGVAVAFFLSGSTGSAQEATLADDLRATRTELAERVTSLQGQIAEGKLKGGARKRAEEEVRVIQERLEHGDFHVGDLLVITIRQDVEKSDTATVRDSLKVAFTGLPDASIAGVLRSELTERISAHLARYLRNATVRTNVLTRIGIFGHVATPGYYNVSPDRPVTEMLMRGGLSPDAKLDKIELRREGRTLISRGVVKGGRTLDQLGARSGDEFWVPKRKRINWQVLVQLALLAATLFLTFTQFLEWYYREP